MNTSKQLSAEEIIDAAIELNNACDKMWNSYGISNQLPDHFIKHINSAQQKLGKVIEAYKSLSPAPITESREVYVPVSVEDELPEGRDIVADERILVKTEKNGWFECRWDDSYGFYDNEPNEDLDWDGITYWLKKTTIQGSQDWK